jgi:uncharacterized oxidoreductase
MRNTPPTHNLRVPAIRVQPGAANYFSRIGALEEIEHFYPNATPGGVLWIGGERAQAAAKPYLPASYHATHTTRVTYSGKCTERQVRQLAAHGTDTGANLVVGLGGGSVLDTAKAVAHRLQIPFVAIPTIAATCAAWTPLSVWYDDDHRAIDFELFPRSSALVLVEPRILLHAPVDYLRAGIGDTLAKWYEARVLCGPSASLPLTAQLGLGAACQINEVLRNDGVAAIKAAGNGQLDDAFVRVIDSIIAGGGLVGGLGERYTRVAAAHSVHNGLTQLPETAGHLHGAKVAYGILVQLALEGRHEEREELTSQLAGLGLPTRLSALDVDIGQPDKIDALITHTLRPGESIHLLPGGVDAPRLRHALETVEAAR